MPTRLYFPSSGTAPISPALTGWEDASQATRGPLATSKTDTPLTSVTVTKTVSNSGYKVAHRQFISPPLPAAATISGTAHVVMGTSQSSNAANAYLRANLRLISGDGTVSRAASLLFQGGGEFATDLTSRHIFGNINFSAQAGDRLVVELGVQFDTNFSTESATVRIGDPASGTDYPAADYAVGDTGWVEFPADNLFATPATEVTLAGTAQTPTASFDLSFTPPPAEIALAGTAAAATGSFTLSQPATATEVTLAGTAAAATASFVLDSTAAVVPVETSTRYANDGYGYDGMADVYNEPAIEPTPAHIPRSKVMQVHQSMSAPNLVNGVPR